MLGRPVFVLEILSTAWMRPTHSAEGHLFYSKFTALNVNLFYKGTFATLSRIVLDQTPRCHGPAKVKHKISHQLGLRKPHTWPQEDDKEVVPPPNVIRHPACRRGHINTSPGRGHESPGHVQRLGIRNADPGT